MLEGHVGRIIFSRIREGEDLADAIKERVKNKKVKAGVFVFIGSLKEVVLGYYKEGKYHDIKLDGPLEIASGLGNVALDENGDVIIHAHLVVSNKNGEAFGGHLMKDSYVGATAELVIIEAVNVDLQREFDEETGLKLLKLS